MSRFLASIAVLATIVVLSLPVRADAASRPDGARNAEVVQLSAARRHYRYYRRWYAPRYYYGGYPYYGRRYGYYGGYPYFGYGGPRFYVGYPAFGYGPYYGYGYYGRPYFAPWW